VSALRIEFTASLPPIQSAMSIGQDGARIKLDIPEQDLAEVLKLAMLRGYAFRVVVEADTQE